MTNERNESDRDDVHNERVARVYDKLSTERAPDYLDRAILRQAEKAARPAYSRSILWTRPLAWVAVVAICLAITLQVTQVPMPEDVSDIGGIASMDGDAPLESPAAFADSPGRVSEPAIVEQPQAAGTAKAPATRDDKPVLSTDETARSQQGSALVADSPAALQSEATSERRETALEEKAAPIPETIEMQDPDMLRRAEDMVRQRAGSNKEAQHPARGVSGFAQTSAASLVSPLPCSDEDRREPDTWYECIRLLERDGFAELAGAERDRLLSAFPDFEAPSSTDE